MSTGQPAFEGKTSAVIFQQILTARPTRRATESRAAAEARRDHRQRPRERSRPALSDGGGAARRSQASQARRERPASSPRARDGAAHGARANLERRGPRCRSAPTQGARRRSRALVLVGRHRRRRLRGLRAVSTRARSPAPAGRRAAEDRRHARHDQWRRHAAADRSRLTASTSCTAISPVSSCVRQVATGSTVDARPQGRRDDVFAGRQLRLRLDATTRVPEGRAVGHSRAWAASHGGS